MFSKCLIIFMSCIINFSIKISLICIKSVILFEHNKSHRTYRQMEDNMRIIYWSDYACPYCYIAEARLKKAISELHMQEDVELEPRAFELDPYAPEKPQSDTPTRFAAKYRLPLDEALKTIEHISQLGKEVGLDFRYATTRYTNTFNSHRLMKMALATGSKEIAERTNELLFAAYFTKNLELSDKSVLIEAGKLAGMVEADIVQMLDSDKFASEVRTDEKEAATLGIHGVPYYRFENGITVPGAISVADFRQILSSGRAAGSGKQCGPDGCRID